MGNSQPSTTQVVAAAGDIKLGTVLTAANLSTVDIAGTPPKGAILEKDKNTLVGRGVISDLVQGEPILDSRLAPAGSGGGMAATIPQGMRAMAVKVDDVVGVAGFATPGMHVDVLSSVPERVVNSAPTQQDNTIVKTILQNIEVLSAGVNIQKDAEGKPQQVQVVNLLVTPEDAEKLSLAANGNTRIQLVLRNPLDTNVSQIPSNVMANLFDGGPKPKAVAKAPAPKPAAKPFSIEILNGSKRSETKFGTPTPEEKK
jgi:pilus assembly protein CpaB